jgi:type I restriction enzyme S subunit
MTRLAAGWRSARLGDHLRIKHGFAFKGEFFADAGSYVLLTPGNFRADGGIQGRGEREKYYVGPIPEDYVLRRGDLLMVMTDLTQDAPILGSPAFIPQDDRYLHNQRLGKVVDVDETALDRDFLYHLLNSGGVRAQIRATATGATVRHTAPERIYAVNVDLPPIDKQRHIAATLSAYDSLIENSLRRIAILEEMARATYRQWVVGFRNPGSEMEEPAGGDVPAGWGVMKLGDLAQDVRRSVNPATIDPDTPYFGLEHLPRRSLAIAEWGRASDVQSTKLRFQKGEILFGKIRPYFHKVCIAPTDGICSSDAIVIVPRLPQWAGLVLGCVSSDEFVAHATQTSQGTKMPRASWDVLAEYPVAVPPPGLLSRFDNLMADFVHQIQILVSRNRNLRRTRDLLLPRLISGEIEVPEAEAALAGATV